MDKIISDLEDKVFEAAELKNELNEYLGEIETAIWALEEYIDVVQTLLESLRGLPSVSIRVKGQDVEFDS